MLIGLQGSGKTTTAAKLARMYAKQGQHPILAAADTYRPAAQDQLRTLGAQISVPVVGEAGQTPLAICEAAREAAATRGLTPLILDTAGRLHIDEAMLDELKAIKRTSGAAPRAARRRRHDRTGCGHGVRSLQPGGGHRRRRPHQDGR